MVFYTQSMEKLQRVHVACLYNVEMGIMSATAASGKCMQLKGKAATCTCCMLVEMGIMSATVASGKCIQLKGKMATHTCCMLVEMAISITGATRDADGESLCVGNLQTSQSLRWNRDQNM